MPQYECSKCPFFPPGGAPDVPRLAKRKERRRHRFLRLLWIDISELFHRHVSLH